MSTMNDEPPNEGNVVTAAVPVERNAAGFRIVYQDGVPFASVTSSTNTFLLPLDHDIFDTDTTTTAPTVQEPVADQESPSVWSSENEDDTTVPTVNDDNTVLYQPDTHVWDTELMQPDIHHLDIEICGLANSGNGRSCTIHNVCGCSVSTGDVLRLRATVANINGEIEDAIILVKIVNGMEACNVAYVPRMQSRLPTVREQVGRFCMVTELYKDSFNTYKRRKDNHMMGAGLAVLLDTIPQQE